MNTLETRVLELIGESTSSPDVFTDTDYGIEQIRDSINDAVEEITMVTGSYKVVYRMPLIENHGFYRLRLSNGSIGWVTDVFMVGNKFRLTQTSETRISSENPRWMVNVGSPREYFQIGNDVLAIYPRAGSSSDIAEVSMVVIPARYTSGSDRVFLRDAFSRAAVHYAVSEFWASRGDARSAVDHYTKYLENLGLQEIYPRSAERIPYQKTVKQ